MELMRLQLQMQISAVNYYSNQLANTWMGPFQKAT